MGNSIFISYSRRDSDFASKLADDLRAKGKKVWMDISNIEPGQKWDRSVQRGLEQCENFVVILSPSAVNSENVLDETDFAIAGRKKVIPVLYKDCTIPLRLRRTQYIDFRENYEAGLSKLENSIINTLDIGWFLFIFVFAFGVAAWLTYGFSRTIAISLGIISCTFLLLVFFRNNGSILGCFFFSAPFIFGIIAGAGYYLENLTIAYLFGVLAMLFGLLLIWLYKEK